MIHLQATKWANSEKQRIRFDIARMVSAVRIASTRVPATLHEPEQLFERIRTHDLDFELSWSSVLGMGISRGAISRNIRILDSALDLYTKAQVVVIGRMAVSIVDCIGWLVAIRR